MLSPRYLLLGWKLITSFIKIYILLCVLQYFTLKIKWWWLLEDIVWVLIREPMNNKKYCTYTFSKVAFSLWICLFKMSISPRANCNFSLSLASLAFVRTWFSFSSYYKWQMANKWNNIQLVEWKHANLHFTNILLLPAFLIRIILKNSDCQGIICCI